MSDAPLFETTGLDFSYTPAKADAVFNGLNLSIKSGGLCAVLGPNGCGKTTLLTLLAGIFRPDAGRILFRGHDVGAAPRRDLARTLSLAPQEPGLDFPFTVRETVAMGRHPYIKRFAAPGPDDDAAVEEALIQMDLGDLADKPVTGISGGEKQRVILARTLAQEAEVMLLDEPTANLDINHAWQVMARIRRLVDRSKASAIMVSHDLDLAAAFCDQAVLLKKGRLVASGPSAEILTSYHLKNVFGIEARISHDSYAGRTVVTVKRPDA